MKRVVFATAALLVAATIPAMAVGISGTGGGPPQPPKKVLRMDKEIRMQPSANAKAKVVTPAANVKATGNVGR